MATIEWRTDAELGTYAVTNDYWTCRCLLAPWHPAGQAYCPVCDKSREDGRLAKVADLLLTGLPDPDTRKAWVTLLIEQRWECVPFFATAVTEAAQNLIALTRDDPAKLPRMERAVCAWIGSMLPYALRNADRLALDPLSGHLAPLFYIAAGWSLEYTTGDPPQWVPGPTIEEARHVCVGASAWQIALVNLWRNPASRKACKTQDELAAVVRLWLRGCVYKLTAQADRYYADPTLKEFSPLYWVARYMVDPIKHAEVEDEDDEGQED